MNRMALLFVCVVLPILSFSFGKSLGQRPQDDDPLKRMKAVWKLELANAKPSLSQLAQQRVDAAREVVESRRAQLDAGQATVSDFLLEAQRNLMSAELLVAKTKEERVAAIEKCWLVAKEAEAMTEGKFKAKTIGPSQHFSVVRARLEIEYELIQAKNE